MINQTALPEKKDRLWIEGKLPITEDEWETIPRDYKNHHSPKFGGKTVLYLDYEGTCLVPVVIVKAAEVSRKEISK